MTAGSREGEDDCTALQKDLDAAYSWSAKTNTQYNEHKFEVLQVWADPRCVYMVPDGGPIKDYTWDLGTRLAPT